jgi:hypothetical protein
MVVLTDQYLGFLPRHFYGGVRKLERETCHLSVPS